MSINRQISISHIVIVKTSRIETLSDASIHMDVGKMLPLRVDMRYLSCDTLGSLFNA
jgi:hypothetical protein